MKNKSEKLIMIIQLFLFDFMGVAKSEQMFPQRPTWFLGHKIATTNIRFSKTDLGNMKSNFLINPSDVHLWFNLFCFPFF